jgi:hypothetical protein
MVKAMFAGAPDQAPFGIGRLNAEMIGTGRKVAIGNGSRRRFVPVLVCFLQLVTESDGLGIGEAHCGVADLNARRMGW